jgi:hypothetical protein
VGTDIKGRERLLNEGDESAFLFGWAQDISVLCARTRAAADLAPSAHLFAAPKARPMANTAYRGRISVGVEPFADSSLDHRL